MAKTVSSAVAAAKIPVSEWWFLLPFNNTFIIRNKAAELKGKSWLTSPWGYVHSVTISKHESLHFKKKLILNEDNSIIIASFLRGINLLFHISCISENIKWSI